METEALPEKDLPQKASPKKDLSKNHILDSALKVIGREGVGALTHRKVAAVAGVSNSTVAYYFRTKEELALNSFRKLLKDNNSIFAQDIVELIEEGTSVSLEEIISIGVGLAKAEFDSGYLLQAEHELILYSRHDEEIRKAYRKWVNAQKKGLQRTLNEEGYTGAEATLIMNLWNGFEQNALTDSGADFADLLAQIKLLLSLFKK